MTLHTLLDDEQKAFEEKFDDFHDEECSYWSISEPKCDCDNERIKSFLILHDQKIITAVIEMCEIMLGETATKSDEYALGYDRSLADLQQALKKEMV